MDRASMLEAIHLESLPKFKTGTFTSVDRTISVNLGNCGTDITSGLMTLRGNGNAVNVRKENSNNITVMFIDNGGNTKISF